MPPASAPRASRSPARSVARRPQRPAGALRGMDRPRGGHLRAAAVAARARSDRRGPHRARRPRAGVSLARISDGDARRIEARRVDPSIYDLPPGPERKPAVHRPTVLGRPLALLMNLPQLAEDIPAGRPYAAVFARPWYGEAAIWRSATEDGFELLDALGRPARIGALAFDLYAGPAGRFDLGNEAWIDLPLGGARQRHRSGAVRRRERPRGRVRRRALGGASVRHRRADEPRPLAAAPPAARPARHRGRDRQPGPGRRAGGDARRGRDAALDRRCRHRPALELADRPGARRRRRSGQPRDRVHAGRARAAALQPGASSRHAAARRRDPAVVDTTHPRGRRRQLGSGRGAARRGARGIRARNPRRRHGGAQRRRRCLPRASPTPPR